MRLLIATICGSTTQRSHIEELNRRLTLQGLIVLAPGVFDRVDMDTLIPEDKKMLDQLHLEKIKLSDVTYFIRKLDGTFGDSTGKELDFARATQRPTVLLDAEQIYDRLTPVFVPSPLQRRR